MQIFTHPDELRAQCRAWRANGKTIALVPTMGYYHAGHESLMEQGRKLADRLVVSLFVNPAQFGPDEDLASYPRDLERDSAIARAKGADALFAPAPSVMYAPDHSTWVEAPELAAGLCGAFRPGHFRGVCTIVLKLLLLAGADFAVFGQKDWQQQTIIRHMVRDLNLPTEIVLAPIVREPDGLAMSSRNTYLSADERARAPLVQQGLRLAATLASEGQKDVGALRQGILDFWAREFPEARVEYLSVVDPWSLEPLVKISGPALLACAVYVGKTRLIDNILLEEKCRREANTSSHQNQ